MAFDTAKGRSFWTKVDRCGPISEHRPDLGPCWNWTGRKSYLGYGQFGRTWRGRCAPPAHRRHWIEINGPIPHGLELDHLCRNRACVRLDHLELVTHAENVRRGLWGELYRPPLACAKGHPRSEYGSRGPRHWSCRECSRLNARRRNGSVNLHPRDRTKCPNGHVYDAVGGHGERMCRTCQRASALAYYYRKKATAPPKLKRPNFQASKTHCPRGHSYNEHARVYQGRRHCGACMKIRKAARKK